MEQFGNGQQPRYVPPELVTCSSSDACTLTYYCYLIELKQDYEYHARVHGIVLAVRTELDPEIATTQFQMSVERGNLCVSLTQVETIHLSTHQVENCRRFQNTLFRILLDGKVDMSADEFGFGDNPEIDYLLLPATVGVGPSTSIVDWKAIHSVPFTPENTCDCKVLANVCYKNGLVCSCKLINCVVTTPQTSGSVYIITDILDLNGNSPLRRCRDKRAPTYKEYFEDKYGNQLKFEQQSLLNGWDVFKVKNYLLSPRQKKQKGSSKVPVELPPELCSVVMSPISINTIYSFTFIPSIMHRIESLLIAFNLKKMLLDQCKQSDIPIIKVLQAITAKGCQEGFNYKSLETLGDSFLKYAATQQLFKTNQSHREGSLTDERKKIISNFALSTKCGCIHKLPGFIRKEKFDPKQWNIPGDKSKCVALREELVSSRTSVYVCGSREMVLDDVADVVEALIGVFISTGDEAGALSFMNWIGIKVDTNIIPYESQLSIPPEELVDVILLESKLNNYSFQDPSLLVEALTHGSYKRPEIPTCYQRLEFLGDAVLDYMFILHFYNEYREESSEFLTDMRSISTNNDCYALSAIKAKLDDHILRNSKQLNNQIAATVNEVDKLPLKSTFGWELETSYPEVLAGVIESLAGAIFVDSGYNKEVVFESIKPLLEPLVTPETAHLQPVKELNELCQKEHFEKKEPVVSRDNGKTSVTIEVKANGITYKCTAKAANQHTAEKLASKKVLKLMKESNFMLVMTSRRFLFPLLSAVFLFCWLVNEVIYHLVYKFL